jgi:hypothetical protein
MDEFSEYQRFSTLNDAAILIDLLDANQIPFKIDDSATRFDMAATSINPLESGIVIQIREIDKDKVDKLNKKTTETAENDHYMYSLSDNDIIDVVVNPEDWSKEEQVLAQEIFKQRNLKPTAEIIKSTRKEKNETENEERIKQNKLISGGASWYLWIGILSTLNILSITLQQNIHFFAGLGIHYVILGMIEGFRRATSINLMPLGYVISLLVSGLFILIWKYSKKENKAIYLSGLIIYGIDTIIFYFNKDWYGFGFHILAMIMIYTGYKALIDKLEDTYFEK